MPWKSPSGKTDPSFGGSSRRESSWRKPAWRSVFPREPPPAIAGCWPCTSGAPPRRIFRRAPSWAPPSGRDATRAALAAGLREACEAAASGDPEAVEAGFEQAGRAGVDGIRSYIDAGIPPANAPLTISGGWIRNFSSGKPVFVPGKGFDKPLYDTGELYNAFDFEVKK